MRILDLFAGIGGFSLGLHRASKEFKTVAFCEMDPFCTQILNKHWPDVPVYPDIRKLNGKELGTIELISAGFPCPAFSRAGKRGGFEKDNLFFEVIRIAEQLNARWILFENVEGFKPWRKTLQTSVKNLGYEWADFILDARDFGIPQMRKRYFAVCVRRGIMFNPQYLRRFQRIKIADLFGARTYLADPERRWPSAISSKEEWRIIATPARRSRAH